MNTLHELFIHTLQDVYFAEQQLADALPKMAARAKSDELRQAMETHAQETRAQIDRLDHVFKLIGAEADSEECEAIEGLVAEAEEIMDQAATDEVRDAGMIGTAQAVEHYEIARYGTLCAWAEQMGQSEVAGLLRSILEEEKAADKKLSDIATSSANQMAA